MRFIALLVVVFILLTKESCSAAPKFRLLKRSGLSDQIIYHLTQGGKRLYSEIKRSDDGMAPSGFQSWKESHLTHESDYYPVWSPDLYQSVDSEDIPGVR